VVDPKSRLLEDNGRAHAHWRHLANTVERLFAAAEWPGLPLQWWRCDRRLPRLLSAKYVVFIHWRIEHWVADILARMSRECHEEIGRVGHVGQGCSDETAPV